MRAFFSALPILMLASNCWAAASEQQNLMAQIESMAQLPEGANPIDDYSRNYAVMPDGTILGIYVIPIDPAFEGSADESCEVVLENFESRPCSSAEIAEIAHQEAEAVKAFGKAGESRWFDDYRDLPGILDGGCSQIEIIFNTELHEFERIECNGIA